MSLMDPLLADATTSARPVRIAASKFSPEQTAAILNAVRLAIDHDAAIFAAMPLLELLRDRYGYSVMRRGVPTDPVVLADTLSDFVRGLEALDSDLNGLRPFCGYGVFFGQSDFAWVDDGYGDDSGLELPACFEPIRVTHFVRERMLADL
jgi:hypothetical protein